MHFRSKDGLYEAVILEVSRQLLGQGGEIQHSERYYGRFQPNITLSQSVDMNKIDA